MCKGEVNVRVEISRSSHSEVFLEKGGLKICSKLTGEHPCRSAISIKLQINFGQVEGLYHTFYRHIYNNILMRLSFNLKKSIFIHLIFLKMIARYCFKFSAVMLGIHWSSHLIFYMFNNK